MDPQEKGSFIDGLRECCGSVSTVGESPRGEDPQGTVVRTQKSGQARRSSRGNITTINAEESNFRQLVLEHTSKRRSCLTDPALGIIMQSPHVLSLPSDVEIFSSPQHCSNSSFSTISPLMLPSKGPLPLWEPAYKNHYGSRSQPASPPANILTSESWCFSSQPTSPQLSQSSGSPYWSFMDGNGYGRADCDEPYLGPNSPLTASAASPGSRSSTTGRPYLLTQEEAQFNHFTDLFRG